MRIWNKPRGTGKTMRMLYASEYTGKSIIVSTKERAHILENTTKREGLQIPKVLCVSDFINRDNFCSTDIIIDEALDVLESLITAVRPGTRISDATLTCYEGVREKTNSYFKGESEKNFKENAPWLTE
jgi:hypothetical protein